MGQTYRRLNTRRAVNPLMSDFVEPLADMCVGRHHIQRQTRTLERSGQRGNETALQIPVEALNLALGLGTVRAADLGNKTKLIGQRSQSGMPTVLALPKSISLGDDGSGVIKQCLLGHAAKVSERLPKPCQPGFAVLSLGETDKACSTKTKCRHERLKRLTASSNGGEVHLYLLAGQCLETYHRLFCLTFEGANISLQTTDAAAVPQCRDLTQQDGRRNPVWARRLNTLVQVVLEGVDFARTCGSHLVTG
ncbi:hypothetical protein CFBP3846_P400086 (plasmid) [Pseudomonas syringae pv. avii]|uniref:Uncharacterized protein n=3 Tax=Pseudomonas TaxID=286 RepID=A0ABY1UH57_PSESX|nr:hypothetical protein PCPL58_p4067 [Pseudomonas cerasi]SOS30856.1 hypothetical protein CFBP3846_P400013 [Pseudomonas syringae pv. avii]SOS30914.1 hypothetical protein CFBP3846_P400071 [Pseudomonas syringae pv. avii]SOS30929.1 hypothetical protein CFBP3846_P400086 [Pseudomonas syringae pv. avii]SPD89693.1 hypothetical protein PSCFBP3800_P200057 [Pseudomonas syringae group genomosp. 3]